MSYIGNTPGVSSQRFVNTYELTTSTTTWADAIAAVKESNLKPE